MSDELFPALPGLKWDIRKTPGFRTAIQQAVGGREVRVSYQPYPIWRWTLAFEFLRETTGFDEFRTLAGFFTARRGAFDSFLYEDPSDSSVTDENFGTGDGSTVGFQLGRALGDGLFEPIYNLNGAPVIKKNGNIQTPPGDYTVSATGIVTFASAPAVGRALTWTGSFYWRVRFAEDSAEFANFANLFWNAHEISLVQLLGL